jgi:energy-coupling factor transporter ATP-binding protein EcfA2
MLADKKLGSGYTVSMAFDPEQITFFAKTDARGQNVPFGIKAKDRTRHVYVIGKTGMGKSTLLENMAVQDMQHGNGLAFIDPHGATAETLLNYVPEERVDDVMYFAPFDTQNPVAFNVMEDVGPEKRHLVAAGLMSVFKKIWVDAWSARMEYILQNTILALLEYPDSTLLGVNRMLSDKDYRKVVVENIADPAVKSFWVDEFANYNERYMQEAGDAIKNKIGQFTANPLIRNIIGQPHTSFDLRQMMDERKILIANLSKGLIGEGNANLLGSMLTTRIYLAAMSRADLPPQEMKQMPNFYFYVDEFQSFANATFADILSEARKYHLNLTIAHQYVEQMEEEVKNAVFGNMGTIISFRVGPFDAEVLETIYAPQFYAVDIVNLGFAQVYLTLMIDGIGSRPFSATTLPPIEQPEVSCRDMVIGRSQSRFGNSREGVEATINDWMQQSFAPPRERSGKPDTKKSGDKKPRPDQGAGGQKSNGGHGKGEQRPATEQSPRSHEERPARKNDGGAKGKPPAADLDALRDVLRSIAKPDTTAKKDQAREPTAKSTATTAANTSATETVTPTKKASTASERPKPKPEKAAKPKPPAPPATEPVADTSLKAALAAVLAERQHASTAAPPTPAPSTQSPPPAESVSPPEPAETPPGEPGLNPKELERMLKVTGADNSPLKKR